jgi:predicted phage-related endonuclease
MLPFNYEIQGRHYMAVMNINRVYFCCLYGNNENEVLIRRVDRDMNFEAELIMLEKDFWENNVMAKVPPPYIENGELVLRSVMRRFGAADTSAPEVVLNGEYSANLARYLELSQTKSALNRQVKAVDSEIVKIKGLIAEGMGNSCAAACEVNGTAYTITYNPSQRLMIVKDGLARLKDCHPDIYKEYVTASESRRFYVKPKREESAAEAA